MKKKFRYSFPLILLSIHQRFSDITEGWFCKSKVVLLHAQYAAHPIWHVVKIERTIGLGKDGQ